MQRNALIVTCLLLAACSQGETEPPTTASPPDPVQAQRAASAPPSPAAATQYEFYLLTRNGQPVEDPRIVSTQQDHPCGPIDLVRVPAIPMNDAVFMPAFVVEFDAAGKETGKWGIPNEAEVTEVDGQRLQFQVESGRFWVDRNGALEKLADTASAADIRTSEGMFDCPDLPTFSASDAEQCFRVRDAAGQERMIAMEGVCS